MAEVERLFETCVKNTTQAAQISLGEKDKMLFYR